VSAASRRPLAICWYSADVACDERVTVRERQEHATVDMFHNTAVAVRSCVGPHGPVPVRCLA
jgi:hypothetical protein